MERTCVGDGVEGDGDIEGDGFRTQTWSPWIRTRQILKEKLEFESQIEMSSLTDEKAQEVKIQKDKKKD